MQTDAELLTSYARTRDEAAFTELARRHGSMVYRVALRILRDPHEAEDAAQAAFAVLAIKAGSVGGRGDLAAWLHGVARRVALRSLRDRVRWGRQLEELAMLKSAESAESAEEAIPEDREAALRVLDEELARLPRGERLAVTLRHLEGLSEPEAAAVLGCAVGTLSSQTSKGLARLRERLSRRGATLSGAALVGALGSQAALPVPATLLSSIVAASKSAVAGATGGNALTLAKMEVKAMFWMKVKLVAAVVVGAAVVGGGTGVVLHAAHGGEPAIEKDAEGHIKAKDNKGREWQLEDWKEGTRPYEKDLAKREEAYKKKWGENWDGPVFSNRIMTPGDWKWETVVVLPDPLATQLRTPPPNHKGYWRSWGGSWPGPGVYAPGAGEVTDCYGGAGPGYVHYDPKTKKVTFIGSPTETGHKDGLGGEARIANGYGAMSFTLDIVSGRVYWVQGKDSAAVLRYVEKLLPYKSKAGGPSTGSGQGKEYLLPAFLDYKDQYKLVKGPGGEELEPVMKDGQRADPSFAVRTTKLTNARLPGKSPRPLITPDGKAIWLTTKQTWPRRLDVEFENAQLRDIETGNVVAALKPETPFPVLTRPTDGVGSHGGTCLGLDGKFYLCEHTGCGGGPMRLISVDPTGGKLTHLYDSVLGVHVDKRASKQWDGPADALTITATSTLIQVQCPRTGAIVNAGWDNTGTRRYLDGFVTSLHGGSNGATRPGWSGKDVPKTAHHNCEPAIAPNGDIYFADPQSEIQRIWRMYRTDWPKEQPEYGYGEQVMPKAKLEELMLEYAKKYVANYEANSKF